MVPGFWVNLTPFWCFQSNKALKKTQIGQKRVFLSQNEVYLNGNIFQLTLARSTISWNMHFSNSDGVLDENIDKSIK